MRNCVALSCAMTLAILFGCSDSSTPGTGGVGGDGGTGGNAGTGGVCSAIMNTGCAADEKCAVRFIVDDITTPGTTECMPNGSVAIGGACEFAPDVNDPTTEIDNCMAPAGQGVFCRSGICAEACAAGAPGTCPDRGAQPQWCERLSRTYDDQATPTGVCALQCSPIDKASCATGEGCYLVQFDMESEFACANAAVPDPPPTAGEPCPADAPGGGCFLNGSPPGSTTIALNADLTGSIGVVAPYCVPAATSSDPGVSVGDDPISAANGLNGAMDLAGNPLECVTGNLNAGGTLANGAGVFQCRFFDSAFSNTANLPDNFGFCAGADGNPNGASGWNDSSTWSLQGLVDDIADNGAVDDIDNLCFGCVPLAVFEAALARRAGPAAVHRGIAVWRSQMPELDEAQLRKLEALANSRE